MNKFSVVVGFALFIACGQCIATGPPPLAGVWRFERELDRRADGSPLAAGPALGYDGILVLTPDGFMSVTIMPHGRKWTVGSATSAELRETVETGTAYSGPYTVDTPSKTLAVDVTTGIDPEDVGKRLTRHYSLTGDKLSLSGSWRYKGETVMFTIDFRRIK